MLLTLLNAASSVTSKINIEAIIDKLISWGIDTGKDLIGAILIYVIGRFIIKQITKLVNKILIKRKLEVSVQTFLRSLLSITLNLILAFAIIARLGVETTSFAAILASAGVAIGMALSGNLSNFAGGLIILVFEDFEKVKAVIERLINEDERILKDPAPFIGLGALSASSVDIKVRAWASTANYWDVYFDFNKKVYETFNKEGIGFPFPQLTVHQAKD